MVGQQKQVAKLTSPTATPIPTHQPRWRACHARGWTHGTHTTATPSPQTHKSAKNSQQIGRTNRQTDFFCKTASCDLDPGARPHVVKAKWNPKFLSIFEKKSHSSVCTWSMSNSAPGAVIALVVNALCQHAQNAGPIPTVTILVSHPAVVNLMRKLSFHAQKSLPEDDQCTHASHHNTLEWSI